MGEGEVGKYYLQTLELCFITLAYKYGISVITKLWFPSFLWSCETTGL